MTSVVEWRACEKGSHYRALHCIGVRARALGRRIIFTKGSRWYSIYFTACSSLNTNHTFTSDSFRTWSRCTEVVASSSLDHAFIDR